MWTCVQACVRLLESSVENKEVWHDAGGILALVRLLEKAAACGDTVLAGRAVRAPYMSQCASAIATHTPEP